MTLALLRQARYSAAMDIEHSLRRLRFRAWHRGTREADFMIGGFFDRHSPSWGPDEIARFEALLAEEDVDIMAWAIGTEAWPKRYQGPLAEAMMKLDYIPIAK